MKFLNWLIACITVYLRRLSEMNRSTKIFVVALIFCALLSATIGLPATIVLLVICILFLPILNADIKNEIDQEYTKRK